MGVPSKPNFPVPSDEYLRDESRSTGHAESISFPSSTEEIQAILKEMWKNRIPVTIQGARTGLTAGAVPCGGHILNLSRMTKYSRPETDPESGQVTLTAQPGVPLLSLRKFLKTQGLFFSPDPTETSASLGGMAACNASGARSFRYGSMRNRIFGLTVVLADGDVLHLKRGENFADGRHFQITTESGRKVQGSLPSYHMPRGKNASGYYAADGMDLIDLFIGSDGTLGVISQMTLQLLPNPAEIWGVLSFFDQEEKAVLYVRKARESESGIAPASLEFFNHDALNILRNKRTENSVFSQIHPIKPIFHTAIYTELHGDSRKEQLQRLFLIGQLMEACGGSGRDTWVSTGGSSLENLMFFRHAVPESVNLLIDERKRQTPGITKLASDMAVPNEHLCHVLSMYRDSLQEHGLESAIWGHIGNNHLHVNLLPKTLEEYQRGKSLFTQWAKTVTREYGGTVSAEHGIGKLKTSFLEIMYSEEGIQQMRRLKALFDPSGLLSPGNLFPSQTP